MLRRFNMSECKTSNTPLDHNQRLSTQTDSEATSGSPEYNTKFPYQEIVGSILYLSQTTRPDVTFSACTLSFYNNKPNNSHIKAAKRVLRYLKMTKELALQFNKTNSLVGYCDADWGSNQDDRKFISGYIFMYKGAPISWSSKKQQIIL